MLRAGLDTGSCAFAVRLRGSHRLGHLAGNDIRERSKRLPQGSSRSDRVSIHAAAASTKPDAEAEQERGVSNMPVKGMEGRGNTWDARLSDGRPIPVLSNKTRPLGPKLRGMLGRRFRGNI